MEIGLKQFNKYIRKKRRGGLTTEELNKELGLDE